MRASLPAALVAAALALALPAPAAAGTPGSADVAALQTGLSALGLYDDDVDGFAGPVTLDRIAQAPGSLHPARRRHARRARRLRLAPARQPADPRGLLGLGRRRTPVSPRLARLPFGNDGRDVRRPHHCRAHALPALGGIDPIGIAGPQTLAALREPVPTSPIRLARPIFSRSTDGFGPRGTRFHTGIDYPAVTGAPVPPPATAPSSPPVSIAGYGNLVVLAHGSGVTSWYGHLSRILVSPGQRVARGTTVGLVGATGDATGPHLHFEVRVRDAAVDPKTALG